MKFKLISLLVLALLGISSTKISQPTYYQSDFVPVASQSTASFVHNFGSVPSFVEVYVANWIESDGIWTPNVVIPYKDWQGGCITVLWVSRVDVTVLNNCIGPAYIRIDASLYQTK
jgi:hypothetical protein